MWLLQVASVSTSLPIYSSNASSVNEHAQRPIHPLLDGIHTYKAIPNEVLNLNRASTLKAAYSVVFCARRSLSVHPSGSSLTGALAARGVGTIHASSLIRFKVISEK